MSIQHSSGREMPDSVEDRPILEQIWKRVNRKDKNYMAIICGDTGSGKSEFGLRLCEHLDPEFSEDQIAFTIEEFLELVAADKPAGSAILFDEVGVALSHSTHYDEDQIRLNHVLETWREQNRVLIMTAPHIRLVQKASRGLLHAQLDMLGINYGYWLAEARYRKISVDTDTGDLYKKYPRLDDDRGLTKKFRKLQLYKPTPEIVEPYLKRKREFNAQLNEESLAKARGESEDGPNKDRSPSEIAEAIIADGVDPYVDTHAQNGRAFVSKELVRADYGLSHSDADTVKKLVEREVDLESR